MRTHEIVNEDEPMRIKLSGNNEAAKAWIQKVYAKYPGTFQNNHVMTWGEGDAQQLAMFELVPSFSRRGAVEVKWFQAYPLRQGVGSRAMKELQALAREDGIELTLFPWDKGVVSQSKLTKFYKGQGFKPVQKGGKSMYWAQEKVAEGAANANYSNLLGNILNQLHQLPYADKIIVFGSVARKSENPKDLDIAVEASVPYSSAELKKFRHLIQIGQANYGSFDPFIKFTDLLVTRNDDCTGWKKAKNSQSIISNIKKEGVPLLSILSEDSYQPPSLEVGDKILKGKFKNSPAEIKGFTKDKHNQPVLKTNKGPVQLFKPRIVKLVKEGINPDILHPEFTHEQEIGDFVYTARYYQPMNFDTYSLKMNYKKRYWLEIVCKHGNKSIGSIIFEVKRTNDGMHLESYDTEVNPAYRNQGIASTMYAYAKMLGNDIKPSPVQLPDGESMWAAWTKSGEAKHLTTEAINPDILQPGFKHKQEIDGLRYTATHRTGSGVAAAHKQYLHICCYDGREMIGYVMFQIFAIAQSNNKHLESEMVWVARDYRKRKIAYTMYAYARMLGNTIEPSDRQLPDGKSMWDAWTKSGEAKHLTTEGFNQPYPIKWEKSDYGDHDAFTKLPDGTPLSIMFSKQQDSKGQEAVQVEFYRSHSQEVSGEGDAQRIFATVLNATQQYIKKHKPLKLFFSAAKLDPTANHEPGAPHPNPESRAKLYTRLVQRYAGAWGYNVKIQDEGSIVRYELSKSLKEAINPDILHPEFTHEQEIGDYTYTAAWEPGKWGDDFVIRAYDGPPNNPLNSIASIIFNPEGPDLISQDTFVDEKYRNKGVSSTMYAYARMLGNTIAPSTLQTTAGKGMWDAWTKSGDAKHLMKEAADSAEKPMTQCSSQDLQKLLGRGKTNALIRHPWFQRYNNYEHAFKHGVDRMGFTKVEVYPFFSSVHTTAEGKLRPLTKLEFTFSYKGTKVVQVEEWYRAKEPDDNERRMGPGAGWRHMKTWATDKQDTVDKAWDKHWDNKAVKEEINHDILRPGFKHSQRIGDYLLTADKREGKSWLNIRCYENGKVIGKANFYIWGGEDGQLQSASTEVKPEYRKKGIGYTMYAYAKMLGNDVRPSGSQTDNGRAMWAAWTKSGEAKHLTTEEELTEYEHSTPASDKIIAKLKSLGYEQLGGGLDATVWSKDAGSVVKILMPSRTIPGRVSDAERGFLTFYEFCQEHDDSPNLPKFVDIGGAHHTVFEIDDIPYRQIAMERLKPLTPNSFESYMIGMLADLAKMGAPWSNIVNMLKRPSTWASIDVIAYRSMPDMVKQKFADPDTYKHWGMLYITIGRLYRAGLKAGLGWDLHGENVMQRNDGTVVITDPYFT